MVRRVSGWERGSHKDMKKRLRERKETKDRLEQAHNVSLWRRELGALMATLFDPTSRGYKRARKHHYKSTKNRVEGLDKDWTPFRAAEKKYKARFPPPDLSNTLDLALLDEARSSEIERGGWKGRLETTHVKEIGLKDTRATTARARKAFIVTAIPGA